LLLAADAPPLPAPPNLASPVAAVELIMFLLVAVVLVVLLSRKLGLPDPVLLVIGGLLLSFIPGLPKVHLNPELVFVFFLPPLLYPAALMTSWRDFHANLRPILLLAIGLVIFTTVAVAWFAHSFIGLSLGAAFVLGAIISPSDAVAATAITQRMKVPRSIVTILDGESLVNDTTSFVLYRFAVAAVVTGTFSVAAASGKFFVVGLGGIAVGLLAGFIATNIQRRLDDPSVQTTLSLVTPFATYLGAEHLGVSGVLAVVICGLYAGWRAPQIISPRTRMRVFPVWELVVFILNGLVFILIGLQLPEAVQVLSGRELAHAIFWAALLLVLVVTVRLAWIFGLTYVPRSISKKIRDLYPSTPWRHALLIGWTGMRGVDSLAVALALPLTIATNDPFPDRAKIFFLTFSVIFGTLVLQGLTLAPFIRWLNVVDDHAAEKEERHARIAANKAAFERISAIKQSRTIDPKTLQRLRLEYEDRIKQLEQTGAEPAAATGGLFSADYVDLTQAALDAERETILKLRNDRVINDEVLRRIQWDIDLAETRLQHGIADDE
jgi:CPA1 family monovalent cation:H+ antiporter